LEKLAPFLCGKDPPQHLYHYTSISGLEGILTSRSLWASQIHFLNDTQEFRYSIEIFRKVLSQLRKEYPIPVLRAIGPTPLPTDPEGLLGMFYNSAENFLFHELFAKTPICVFSLSENGDLLTQWRGYCPPGGGYSIGFSSKRLIQFLKTLDLYIERYLYDDKEQEAIVKGIVTKSGEKFLKTFTGLPEEAEKITQGCLVDLFMDFSRVAAILKHPSFYEECEWRIISGPIENRHMSFRVGKSMLIPYFLISFEGIEPFPIDEIIIGPTPEQSLAKSSLFQFLLRNNLKISIESSKTPYRVL
jgi:hypothetical protein